MVNMVHRSSDIRIWHLAWWEAWGIGQRSFQKLCSTRSVPKCLIINHDQPEGLSENSVRNPLEKDHVAAYCLCAILGQKAFSDKLKYFPSIFQQSFPQELVYRVHPLPESLIDVVSDFGSLSEASEVVNSKGGISSRKWPARVRRILPLQPTKQMR